MSEGQHVVCTGCGAVNRYPEERGAAGAKCGKCGIQLFNGHPAEISAKNMQRQIDRSTVPVLVDVWAPWCGPCRVMGPEFEKAARMGEPQLRFVKLNSDTEQAMAQRLGISSIPTLLLFHRGREVARIAGALTAAQIERWSSEKLAAVS